MTKNFVCALVLAGAGVFAMAAPPVYLETPVAYLPDAKVAAATRRDCQFERRLATYIGKKLTRINRRAAATVDANGQGIRPVVLRVAIAEVSGDGGLVVNDVRSVTLTAAILEGGQERRRITVTRSTDGGNAQTYAPDGNCFIAWRSMGAAGGEILRWVRNPDAEIAPTGMSADTPDDEAR
jgi:hypothetical protein